MGNLDCNKPVKKILHICITENFGGIESFQKSLFLNIDREKYHFDFIAISRNSSLIDFFKENGSEVYVLPSCKRIIGYCRAFYKIIKDGKYDVVHFHKNSCANSIGIFIAHFAGVKKIITHAHNTSSISGGVVNLFHHLFKPFVNRWSHIKLACSPEAGKWIFSDDNFELIKNGIDIDKFKYNALIREETRNSLGLRDNFIIGHVGNFIPQKNHKFMVDIISEVVKFKENAVLMLVGRGDLMEETKKYAIEKGVIDNVRFLGSRTDAHNLYQAMDMFLFPSFHEGLPIAGVEAQTSGLPCFFSDAISDTIVLSDTVTYMSLELSAKEWAEKIIDVTADFERKDISGIISDAGYDVKKTARRIEEIYN